MGRHLGLGGVARSSAGARVARRKTRDLPLSRGRFLRVRSRGALAQSHAKIPGAGPRAVLLFEGMTLSCRSVSSAMLALLLIQLLAVSAFSGVARAEDAGTDPAADIVLTNGVTYRARLRLNFFQCLASEDRIARKFGDGGFAGVRVFMSADQLPPDWPEQFRSKAGSCERYAEGVWARPSMPRRRPSSIDAWWVAVAGGPDEPAASLDQSFAPFSSPPPSAPAQPPRAAARPSPRQCASGARAVDVDRARSLA
jgi:hypothetical protein